RGGTQLGDIGQQRSGGFFFRAEDGIRDFHVTGVQTCALPIFEAEMIEGPWIMGDSYTVADGYFFAVQRWLTFSKIDIADYPKLERLVARMKERPAVIRALAEEVPAAPAA